MNFTGQTGTIMNVTMTGNTLSNTHAGNIIGGGGLTLASQGQMIFNVDSNNLSGANGSAVTLFKANAGTDFEGTFNNNTIGTGTVDLGSKTGNGIFLSASGAGTITLAITNNTIQNVHNNASIYMDNTGGSYTVNATITGNQIKNPGSGAFAGIALTNGANTSGDTVNVFAKIASNVFSGTVPAGYFADIVLGASGAASGHSFTLSGANAGNVSSFANIQAFLAATNTTPFGNVAYADSPATISAFQASASLPPLPATPAPLLLAPTGGTEPAAPSGTGTPDQSASGSTDNPTGETADQSSGQTDTTAPDQPATDVNNVNNGILTQDELDTIVAAAIQRWEATGLSAEQITYLQSVTFSISDLSGWNLGSAANGHVSIDINAAGHGWFIDPTPFGDSEFGNNVGGALYTLPSLAPAGHVDLLTTVMHELGHELGLSDTYSLGNMASIMYGYIVDGERRLPTYGEADGGVLGAITGMDFALGTVSIGTLPAGKSVTVYFDATVDNDQTNVLIQPATSQAFVTSTGGFNATSNLLSTPLDSLSLGDRVFVDANNNNAFDSGEGVSGVALTLFADNGTTPGVFDAGDTQIATTVTGADGVYSFTGLAPGDYIVRVDQSNLDGGGALHVGANAASSMPGQPDPNNNVDNDDNGASFAGAGGGVVSLPIALSYNSEPVAGNGNDTNNTLDFGFIYNLPPTTPTDTDLTANSVVEGASAGTAVGVTAHSTDPDGPSVTYSLTNDAGGRFQIDSSTGIVTVTALGATTIDYEFAPGHAYTVTVAATDNQSSATTQDFVIDVTDVAPSAPVDTDGAVGGSVSEGASNGDAVGITASSTDVNGPAVTYSLLDSAGGRFQIDAAGVVTVANASLLNYEDNTSHTITVRASDGTLFTDQTFTITVTDVAPTAAVDTDGAVGGSVSEGASNGDAVGITASSTDVHGGTVTYSLFDNAGGRFQIDAAGVVTVANASLLNYEDNTSHTITVRASDPSGAFTDQTFTIAVTDVAPSAPVDTDGAVGGSVSEGASNGDAVGITASSTDVHGGTVTYSLFDNAGGRFQIDAAGVVTVANASLLNYEDNTSHTITVRASDPSGAFTDQTFTIAVTDVAPTAAVDTDGAVGGSVSEGASNGDAVGITASSIDVHGGTVTYSLFDNAGGRFQIDAAGVVTVANASLLNYEDNTSHTITVRASDPSGAFTDQTFTIAVTDVAPSAPVDTDGAVGGSVSEGASNGDAVGITASSTDVHGGTVTYSLFDNAGGRFQIDAAGVVTVANASLLNYEDNTSHTITVRASDPSGAFTDQTFTIAVTDVAPTAAVDTDGAVGGSVSEGASNGDAVGITASSTDVHGGTVTYSLFDNAGGRFQIDAAGVVTVANASLLNYEDNTSHTITVRASDPSGAFTDQTFTIAVTDVAPTAPVDTDGAVGGSVSEGASNGDAVGITASSTDVHGGTVTYSLFDNAGGRFQIDAAGVVTVANASLLNYEDNTSHTITVRASDPSGAFTDQTFTIAVTDVAPTAAAESYSINEDTTLAPNAAAGVLANDSDVNGGALTAVLDSGPLHAASFTLNADGSFSYTPAANYNGSDSFTYHVSDGTLASGTVTASLTINAVNDAPVAAIAHGNYHANENESLNLKNTGLSVSDVDAGAGSMSVTLSVSQGNLTVTAGGSGATVAGSGTGLVTITGTLAQLNALLNSDAASTVSFKDATHPIADHVTLTLSVNDNGNTGLGGALIGTTTAAIDIRRADDHHHHDDDHHDDGGGNGGNGGNYGGYGHFGPFIGNFGLGNFFIDNNSFHLVNFVRAGLSRPDVTASVGDDVFAIQVSLADLFSPLGGNVSEIFARQANGDELPSWLHFDPTYGILAGKIPAGSTGTIRLEVVAQDSQARQAITVFTLDLATGNVVTREGRNLPLPGMNERDHAHKASPNRHAAVAVPADIEKLVERLAEHNRVVQDSVAVGSHDLSALPVGRAGLSEQLKNVGWRGMHAQRTALLDSVRQHAARLH